MWHARAIVLIFFATGCAGSRSFRPSKKLPPTPPSRLCRDARLGPKDFCLDAARVEKLLRSDFEVAAESATSGLSRPTVLTLWYRKERVVIRAKWKPSKANGESFNNSPRRELAAYAVQKLFLDPDEYVVPPTVGRCLDEGGSPTFADTSCVFGVLSYWVENVSQKGVFDQARLERDAAYRETLANMNVLAYLIDHRDTRPANFLISTDPRRPRVFSIDNGLAFSGFRNPRAWFVHGWNEILVALPRRLTDRLARITRADLDRLAVVAQYRVKDRMLVQTAPQAPFSPQSGVRRSGAMIQLGLTTEEIDQLEQRLNRLRETKFARSR
jgi:hypothetical protein